MMNRKHVLLWGLSVGLLAGLALGPSPAAANSATVTGTVMVDEDPEEGIVQIYLETDDGDYLVTGRKAEKLREADGRRVTVRGNVTEDESGDKLLEIKDFVPAGK